jgi:UDP-N-acetylmuramoylalanine--D-glutamate ligase
MTNWNGMHVLIIGAARQGLALARFLAIEGADIVLNDKKSPEDLNAATLALENLPVKWALGHHDTGLLEKIDLVCISGGVPLSLPLIQEAQKRGIPLSNDSEIFMSMVSGKVIGITGSAGKTTTTTLVGRMADKEAKSPRKVWVGGNIGLPLIDVVREIQAEDLVVMEFSSFQLELMTHSPHISAILNIKPNHLDRHGTLEVYTKAKSNILKYQQSNDITILGRDDPGAWNLAGEAKGRVMSFGFSPLPDHNPGTSLHKGKITLIEDNQENEIMSEALVVLRGKHNLQNVLAACMISYAAGISFEAMTAGVEGFTGLPHRLEYIRTLNGSQWYNDSKATSPDEVIASVQSFNEPIILLLGGRDKDLPWDELVALIRQRIEHLIVFGEAAPKILKSFGKVVKGQRPYSINQCVGVQETVKAAALISKPGDVVLLSPGGTSFDEFNNYEERGDRFREWVNQLT